MSKDYELYQPSRAEVQFTFLYPADWKLRESVKDGYAEVFAFCKSRRQELYTVSLTAIVVYQTDQTPSEVATDFLNDYFPNFNTEKKGPFPSTVANIPAVEIEIAYWMPLPLNSINSQRVEILDRFIFFKQRERLYKLCYAAPIEDYEHWLEAFQTLVKSFTLLKK